MTRKRRPLTANEQWVLDAVLASGGARIAFVNLCVAWARELGTDGNAVTWPKFIVSRALRELEARGLLMCSPPSRAYQDGGAA